MLPSGETRAKKQRQQALRSAAAGAPATRVRADGAAGVREDVEGGAGASRVAEGCPVAGQEEHPDACLCGFPGTFGKDLQSPLKAWSTFSRRKL